MNRRPEILAVMDDLAHAQQSLSMMLAFDDMRRAQESLKDIEAARTRLIVLIGGE